MRTVEVSRDSIVLVHSSDELYGSDRMVLQVVDSMPSSTRSRLTVLLPQTSDSPGPLTRALEERGVTVTHRALPILRRRELTRPLALLALMWRTLCLVLWYRRNGVETVYCATSATALSILAARPGGARRSIAHVQEVWEGPERKLLGFLIQMADDVVATSQAVMNAFPPSMQHRANLIENGIDTPLSPVRVRKPEESLRLLVASRWSARKGYQTLMRAWESLETPPGVLVIAGSRPALGEHVDVPAMVRQLSRPESVEIVGQVDSIFDLLDGVDAVIVPSDRPEAFGLIVIEAFSRQRAAIGSAGGGLDEIIDDGVNGLKFTPGDSEELASLLAGIDRSTLTAMGRAGLTKFESRYSASAFAQRMQDLWCSNLDSGSY